MSAHTPGPWISGEVAGGFAEIYDENHDLIFGVCYPSLGMGDKKVRSPKECYANLRLIAAAPALLEALKEINERWKEGGYDPEATHSQTWRKIRSAIAKAEGRQ